MDTAKLYAVGAFAAGLIITLFLAAYLTPRSWWRRPNARALFILVAGAWGFGSLILWAVHSKAAGSDAALAAATQERTAAAARDAAAADAAARDTARRNVDALALNAGAGAIGGQPFRVHRDLNLRSAAGVNASRLIVVPAGATVTPTGVRSGDWWQIKASVDGRESTGWVSSLWLRRSGE